MRNTPNRNKKNRAVFLDRDGTLIAERGHLSRVGQVHFLRGTVPALRNLRQLGFKVYVVSNQSGVARGLIKESEVVKINRFIRDRLAEHKLRFDGIFYCPHHPTAGDSAYTRKCICRKPSPGMIRKAARRTLLMLSKSYVVGDKLTDVQLAKNVHAKGILVLTGFGRKENAKRDRNSPVPDYVARNLAAAADWIAKDLVESG